MSSIVLCHSVLFSIYTFVCCMDKRNCETEPLRGNQPDRQLKRKDEANDQRQINRKEGKKRCRHIICQIILGVAVFTLACVVVAVVLARERVPQENSSASRKTYRKDCNPTCFHTVNSSLTSTELFNQTKQDRNQNSETLTAKLATSTSVPAKLSTKRQKNRRTTPEDSWLNSFNKSSDDRILAMQEMMNTAVSPCQDFYQYTCGNFDRYLLSRNVTNKRFITWGKLNSLRLQEALISALETQPQWESDRKAWQVFQACVNRDSFKNTFKIEQIIHEMGGFNLCMGYWCSLAPLAHTLAHTLAKAHSFGKEALFTLSFKAVIPETERMVVFVQASTEISPLMVANLFRDIILNNNIRDFSIVSEVTSFARQLETAIGYSPSSALLFALLQQTFSIETLASKYPNIEWQAFFTQLAKNVNLGSGDYAVTNVSMSLLDQMRLQRLDDLLANYSKTETRRRAMHNYLVTKVMSNFDKDVQASNTGRSGRYDALRRLEKRETLDVAEDSTGDEFGDTQTACLSVTDQYLPASLGSIVERIYPIGEDRRAKAASMLTDLKSVISEAVNSSKYQVFSKQEFLERMNSLRYQIGSPSWVLNQTAMNNYYQRFIAVNSVVWNNINAFRFELGNNLKAIGKPDIETPKSVLKYMAFISYGLKSPKLTVMPLMLYAPVFDPAFPDVLNLATMGNVLAHELHHVLSDDVFSVDPFTVEQANCSKNYFGKFSYSGMPFPSQKTYVEDLADIASLKISYQFYKSLQEKGNVTSSPVAGLNSDQVFFVAAAQAHCTSYTHEEMVTLLSLRDLEHSPGPYRINGTMANVEEFAKAFNCPLNSPMNPAEKCAVF